MPYRPPHSILGALLLERARIAELIDNVIDHSFRAADYAITNRRVGEVDRLLYFFIEGLPGLESSLRMILRPYGVNVTISGVFCHGTPKVISTVPTRATKSCELADLTFLATYGRVINGNGLGNALMTQAKNRLNEASSVEQRLLYERTESFDYFRPDALSHVQPPNSRTRDIADAGNALWYWSFNRPNQAHYHLRQVRWNTDGILARTRTQPNPFVTPFALTLFDLFAGVAGRGFHRTPQNSLEQNWSRIIDDLLRVTARTLVTGRIVAFLQRGREQLRGDEALRVLTEIAGRDAGFLARCSIGNVFARIDDEMSIYGKKIEDANRRFDLGQFRNEFFKNDRPKKGPGDKSGGEPPILGNERREFEEGENGGGSFVIFDFQGPQAQRDDAQLALFNE